LQAKRATWIDMLHVLPIPSIAYDPPEPLIQKSWQILYQTIQPDALGSIAERALMRSALSGSSNDRNIFVEQ